MSKETILNFAKGKESECKYMIMCDLDENNKVNIIMAFPNSLSVGHTVISFWDFQDENRKEPTPQEIQEALNLYLKGKTQQNLALNVIIC